MSKWMKKSRGKFVSTIVTKNAEIHLNKELKNLCNKKC
jgi:hypothetical protein